MNERVKQLAVEAEEYASQFAYVPAVGHPGYKEKFNEKFAELIVKECAKVVEGYYWEDDIDGYPADREIKKHFGVEE